MKKQEKAEAIMAKYAELEHKISRLVKAKATMKKKAMKLCQHPNVSYKKERTTSRYETALCVVCGTFLSRAATFEPLDSRESVLETLAEVTEDIAWAYECHRIPADRLLEKQAECKQWLRDYDKHISTDYKEAKDD